MPFQRALRYSTIILLLCLLYYRTYCGNSHQYGITINFISVDTITIIGEKIPIVVLRKHEQFLTYYAYLDSSQIVNNFDLTQSSLKKGKRRKIDGHIISCKSESITVRISEYYNSRRQEKFIAPFLISENTIEVSISQIEKLTIWKKGKPGRGALIGVGAGVAIAALGAAAYDPESSTSLVTFNQLQAFGIISIVTAPIGALTGATIGSRKKKIESFSIKGTYHNYKNIKEKLVQYSIDRSVDVNYSVPNDI